MRAASLFTGRTASQYPAYIISHTPADQNPNNSIQNYECSHYPFRVPSYGYPDGIPVNHLKCYPSKLANIPLSISALVDILISI